MGWFDVLRDGYRVATYDDVVALGDQIYLSALTNEIALRADDIGAALVMPPTIESETFWANWDWPEDVAAEQLANWRAQIDGVTA